MQANVVLIEFSFGTYLNLCETYLYLYLTYLYLGCVLIRVMQSSRCRIFLNSKPKLGPAIISLHFAILDPRIAILRILQNLAFSNPGCKICKSAVLEFSDCHTAELPAHYCELLHNIVQTLHNMFVILRGGMCSIVHGGSSRPVPGQESHPGNHPGEAACGTRSS